MFFHFNAILDIVVLDIWVQLKICCKGKIHPPSIPVIKLTSIWTIAIESDSGNQTDSAGWGQLAVTVLCKHTTRFVESAYYCRCQSAFVYYVMKLCSVKLADFAVVLKVWLSQKTKELSDDDQVDVVESVAAEVYSLGGADALRHW